MEENRTSLGLSKSLNNSKIMPLTQLRCIFTLFILTGGLWFSNTVKADEYVAARASYSAYSYYPYVVWDTWDEARSAVMAYTCRAGMGRTNCDVTQNGVNVYQGYNLSYAHQIHISYDQVDPNSPNSPASHVEQFGSFGLDYTCPTSWHTYSGDPASGFLCSRPDQIETPCSCSDAKKQEPVPEVGNPIALAALVKRESDTDYVNAIGTLAFVRSYQSDVGNWWNNFQSSAIDYNRNYDIKTRTFSCYFDPSDGSRYCYRYSQPPKLFNLEVRRGIQVIRFGTASDYLPARSDVDDRATPVFDGNGASDSWDVTNTTNDTVERYGPDGRLTKITSRAGHVNYLEYSVISTPVEVAPRPGFLISVVDSFGNKIGFLYDQGGHMTALVDPEGKVIHYGYDPVGRLTSVTYPDGKSKAYFYGEPDKIRNTTNVNLLTGIVDENGVRYASFYYNGSYADMTEHAGGVNKFSISGYSGDRTVTDPLGAQRIYRFQDLSSPARIRKSIGVAQPSPSGSGWVSSSVAYDVQGNVSSKTDFAGVTTTFTYDLSRNLETSRKEGAGTVFERTIMTEWDSQLRLPVKIAEPLKLTINMYDAVGRLLNRREQATVDAAGALGLAAKPNGVVRTWSYSYNELGQMQSATGPGLEGKDTWTYKYDLHGNRTTVSNALGRSITYSNFDGSGRPGKIVQPNGLATLLTYTLRGWLSTSKVTDGDTSELTSYEYDGAGQLTKVVNPDNTFVSYTYDPAHRLTDMHDSAGNRIHYTLDNAGNRIKEEVTGFAGSLTRQTSRIYDALGMLKQQTGGTQ